MSAYKITINLHPDVSLVDDNENPEPSVYYVPDTIDIYKIEEILENLKESTESGSVDPLSVISYSVEAVSEPYQPTGLDYNSLKIDLAYWVLGLE